MVVRLAARSPSSLLLTESNGLYLEDCQLVRPVRWASDPDKAERLWQLSEKLVAGSKSVASSAKL